MPRTGSWPPPPRPAARTSQPLSPGRTSRPGRSAVRRSLQRRPFPPEILDEFARPLMAYFDELIGEVPALPLHDHRRELPAEVDSYAFVGKPVPVEFQP